LVSDYLMPFVTVDDAARAIAVYKAAFGAIETQRLEYPNGKIARCVLQLGDTEISLHDDSGQQPTPTQLGGSPVGFMISVDDVDAVFVSAGGAGSSVRTSPPTSSTVPGRPM
jgi:PhnB protein